MSKTFLTKEGYDKLQQEIIEIRTVEMKECAEEIAEAREKGDISENAEYDVAMEHFDNLKDRLNKLSEMIANAVIISPESVNCDVVQILTTVCVLNKKTNKEASYTIVPPTDIDVKQGKISVDSPMAQSLIGKPKGESVELKTPTGAVIELQILDIKIQ